MRTRRKRLSLRRILLMAILALLLFIVLFPYTWAILTSFKPDQQIRIGEPLFWPEPFTLAHYDKLLRGTLFLTWFKNSMIVAAISGLVGVVIGAPAAYGLARFRFRGRSVMSTAVLVTYTVPTTLLFIPFMVMMNDLRLINTLTSAVITYATITAPFCTWIMLGFFRSIPVELGESALIDGCGRLGAFLRIELPLSQSGLIAVAIFSFNLAWMEYIYAFTLLTSDSQKTLPIGISTLQVGDVFPWGVLMAAVVLTSLPIAVLFFLLQRYFVAGLTAGAVKG